MEKGSRISVFRSGLVGPKFEPNLFLKQDLCVLFDEGLGNFAIVSRLIGCFLLNERETG